VQRRCRDVWCLHLCIARMISIVHAGQLENSRLRWETDGNDRRPGTLSYLDSCALPFRPFSLDI